jgi:hypothetical protein
VGRLVGRGRVRVDPMNSSPDRTASVVWVQASCIRYIYHRYSSVIVPDSKSRNIPEVVIVRRWAVGVSGNLGRVGQLGEGWGK